MDRLMCRTCEGTGLLFLGNYCTMPCPDCGGNGYINTDEVEY